MTPARKADLMKLGMTYSHRRVGPPFDWETGKTIGGCLAEAIDALDAAEKRADAAELWKRQIMVCAEVAASDAPTGPNVPRNTALAFALLADIATGKP